MKIDEIIIRPILTEKSTNLAKENIYLFEVNSKADKFQIKEAIEKIYKVKVKKINVANRQGKLRRVGRRMKVKRLPTRKIAFIKLKEGKIDIFPQA